MVMMDHAHQSNQNHVHSFKKVELVLDTPSKLEESLLTENLGTCLLMIHTGSAPMLSRSNSWRNKKVTDSTKSIPKKVRKHGTSTNILNGI